MGTWCYSVRLYPKASFGNCRATLQSPRNTNRAGGELASARRLLVLHWAATAEGGTMWSDFWSLTDSLLRVGCELHYLPRSLIPSLRHFSSKEAVCGSGVLGCDA